MTPVEINDLFDGFIWRLSRNIEIVALQTTIIRGMMEETTFDGTLGSFSFYDGLMLPEKQDKEEK